MATNNVNVEQAEQAIEQLLAFHQFRQTLNFDRFGIASQAEIDKLKKRIDDLSETLIPATMVNMMLYYELKLAKQEVKDARYSIIKQAVREVLAEEQQ